MGVCGSFGMREEPPGGSAGFWAPPQKSNQVWPPVCALALEMGTGNTSLDPT